MAIMARTKEYIKRSEARILIFLFNAAELMNRGSIISIKLRIDYIYLMKLLGQMYDKGWVTTSRYRAVTYFKVTENAPLDEAKERLLVKQTQLSEE